MAKLVLLLQIYRFMQAQVLIIGAGIAGLCVARDLTQQGITCVLIEARNRIGGRIWTVDDPSFPCKIDLGANLSAVFPFTPNN